VNNLILTYLLDSENHHDVLSRLTVFPFFFDTQATTSLLFLNQYAYVLAQETLLCQYVIKPDMLLTQACKFPRCASRLNLAIV